MILRLFVNLIFYSVKNRFRTNIQDDGSRCSIAVLDLETNKIVSSNLIKYESKSDIKHLKTVSKLSSLVYLLQRQNQMVTLPAENANFKLLCNFINNELIKNNDAITKELYKTITKVDSEKMKNYVALNNQILHEFNTEVAKIIP